MLSNFKRLGSKSSSNTTIFYLKAPPQNKLLSQIILPAQMNKGISTQEMSDISEQFFGTQDIFGLARVIPKKNQPESCVQLYEVFLPGIDENRVQSEESRKNLVNLITPFLLMSQQILIYMDDFTLKRSVKRIDQALVTASQKLKGL